MLGGRVSSAGLAVAAGSGDRAGSARGCSGRIVAAGRVRTGVGSIRFGAVGVAFAIRTPDPARACDGLGFGRVSAALAREAALKLLGCTDCRETRFGASDRGAYTSSTRTG